MTPKELGLLASLLDEAASVIRRMPEAVFDELEVRYFLCDELEGSALILRGEVKQPEEEL